jgi:hypothetical protein
MRTLWLTGVRYHTQTYQVLRYYAAGNLSHILKLFYRFLMADLHFLGMYTCLTDLILIGLIMQFHSSYQYQFKQRHMYLQLASEMGGDICRDSL